jgi:hypothetical protein
MKVSGDGASVPLNWTFMSYIRIVSIRQPVPVCQILQYLMVFEVHAKPRVIAELCMCSVLLSPSYFPYLVISSISIWECLKRPPPWSSGKGFWLQIHRSGFDSRRYQIFWEVVGLEWGPLSFLSTIEELLETKSSGCGLENREYDRRGSASLTLFYSQKLILSSPTSGDRSVGIVRSLTQATDFVFCCFVTLKPTCVPCLSDSVFVFLPRKGRSDSLRKEHLQVPLIVCDVGWVARTNT